MVSVRLGCMLGPMGVFQVSALCCSPGCEVLWRSLGSIIGVRHVECCAKSHYARLASRLCGGDRTAQTLFWLLLQAPALTTYWQRGQSLAACQQQLQVHRTAAAEAAAAAMADLRQPQLQQQPQQMKAQDQRGRHPAGLAA
jgi:hypothetical protein